LGEQPDLSNWPVLTTQRRKGTEGGADDWLQSETTDLFDQYHELLTKHRTESKFNYFDSVLEKY
jgi:hypothetical protein